MANHQPITAHIVDRPAPPRGTIEFWTSVGGGVLAGGVGHELIRLGYVCHEVFALSAEKYRLASGLAGRIRLRWKMYPGYACQCWRVSRRSRGKNPVRIVTTNPFYAPALVQYAARGHGVTINLLYDLYPDALVQAGVLQVDSWVTQICAAATRRALRKCDATVFLGERLRRHAEACYGLGMRTAVIPVGADGTPFRNLPPRPVETGRDIRILYAGQMGRMHDIETVAAILAEGVPGGVKFTFHASGTGYSRLRRETTSAACEWGGPLPDGEWLKVMSSAQVALVTMARGAENIVMPSKTYSALVAGQAILGICARKSDLADLISKHDCGWVVEPGNVSGMSQVLAEITTSKEELQRKRMNAFRAGHAHYDVAGLAKQWIQLFDSLTAAGLKNDANTPPDIRTPATGHFEKHIGAQ